MQNSPEISGVRVEAESLGKKGAVKYNGFCPSHSTASVKSDGVNMTNLIDNDVRAFLFPIWQEVARHLELTSSLEPIGELVRSYLPLEMLLLWQLEAEHEQVRVAAVIGGARLEEEYYHRSLASSEFRKVERWVRKQTPLHEKFDSRATQSLLQALGHQGGAGDHWLGPLTGEHGALGILLAVTRANEQFSGHHVSLLSAIQEPLANALDNDSRLREIAALREAAEADRRSLLHRLGRKEVGDVIVGDRSGLEHVMQRVEMVTRSDVPVLILGETGTGKELVARAIHNRSDRSNGPFIRVNCGAIPRELIDSHLFGHEKGSFTGAAETRQGWFERADMGTLFLDEIGELPLDAQVRLLRVLQDGFVERVGGTKPIRVNVRVVAATHRDLAAMVRENTFREDLWYRIAVFPILLPPLRDRPEDIPALAHHFAERAAIRFGLTPAMPTEADIELLTQYDWPGNIRELGAVIDRAAILGNGRGLEVSAALGLGGSEATAQRTSAGFQDKLANGRRAAGLVSLDDAMRQHIEATLHATQGRIEGPQGAAKILQINPHTLRGRMRKLGVKWDAFRSGGFDHEPV